MGCYWMKALIIALARSGVYLAYDLGVDTGLLGLCRRNKTNVALMQDIKVMSTGKYVTRQACCYQIWGSTLNPDSMGTCVKHRVGFKV